MGNDGEDQGLEAGGGIIEMLSAPEKETLVWAGGKCGDCFFWVQENPGLPQDHGNCRESPPAATAHPMRVVQPQLLQGVVRNQESVQVQAVMIERLTHKGFGCGKFQDRKKERA